MSGCARGAAPAAASRLQPSGQEPGEAALGRRGEGQQGPGGGMEGGCVNLKG